MNEVNTNKVSMSLEIELEKRVKELERKFNEFQLYTKDLEFQLSAIKEENEYNFEPETLLPLDENENKKNQFEGVFNDKKNKVKKTIKINENSSNKINKKEVEEIDYRELIIFIKEFFNNKELKIK